MKTPAVLAFVFLAGLTPAGAAAQSPWTVDQDASRIEMAVQAFGGSHSGRFNDWRGDVVFDPARPERTQATVVVQAASLTMGQAAMTRRAASPGFLDAGRHPVIRLELRSLQPLAPDRFTARAEVTMKGVSRPVAFPVDLRVAGDRAHLTGSFALNRADFGIGTSGPWSRLIGRQVTVRVALQARRD
ncbi:MAG: YceI family protein [Brevundimonas sp.]|nr:YceI family protein [Brevundimonas sp.]